MKLPRLFTATALVLLMTPLIGAAQTVVETRVVAVEPVVFAKRTTLAVRYPVDKDTKIDLVGTSLGQPAEGFANIKHKEGRTRIELEMLSLPYPQRLGAFYTTCVLWAIAPEGQAERLVQLPAKSKFNIVATTSFQTFGLIITAEPHGMVTLPSPVIVAENTLRKGTKGSVETSQIEYRGDTGTIYVVATPDSPAPNADYNTPLPVLGARRAVMIAHRSGAARYAEAELKDAEIKLAALEHLWPSQRNNEEKYLGLANDVMRLGEHARLQSMARSQQARLAAERRAASGAIAQAQSEAERAREAKAQSDQEAIRAREAQSRSESDAAAARATAAQAQTEAERAKASEEQARLDAESARLQAEQAKQERDQAMQRLYVSLSEILETRREARGLIVNLSDVLFDFNKATLKPGAREKLSKLAGILLAYPGPYKIEIEGHTDAIGSEEYNLKLSQERAESVRNYLLEANVAPNRIIATRGLGKSSPVATNDTDVGRQMNRRVELIISDTEPQAARNNR
jgi:outer membrane protein OmpA-like peptidoglycan-associated protein